MPRLPSRICLLAMLALAIACAAKRPRQPPEMSGFLKDYSLLGEGESDPVRLRLAYRNPKANWPSYDKVIFEPVTLWRSGKGSLDPLPEEDLLRILSEFQTAVRRRLGERFRLVDTAGPGTMRIRLGITDARAADPVLDVLTANAVTGKPGGDGPLHPETRSFLEGATLEGEIRDTATGELLAEGVERRKERTVGLPLETWAQLAHAFALWADRVTTGLEERTERR
jgi:hypothetical protein